LPRCAGDAILGALASDQQGVVAMRRILVALVAALGAIPFLAPPSNAITHGVPDTQHPNVGALVVDVDFDGPGPMPFGRLQLCTGSLLGPGLFLTAGHCTAGLVDLGVVPADVKVSFDADLRHPADGGPFVVDPVNLLTVTGYTTHPDFHCNTSTCYNDVGVIAFQGDPGAIAPVTLPTLGFLDQQATQGGLRDHVFVNVGYGVNFLDRSIQSPQATVEYRGQRQMSTSPFRTLTRTHLFQNTNHAATGQGGTCSADSGSPRFYEAVPGALSNLAVAVGTSGDPACNSLNQSQRLDTLSVREFLDDFVTLP
jgi:Trypsin